VVEAICEWFRLRYCIFAKDSEATRHNIRFKEKLPDTVLEIAKAAEVTRGRVLSVVDCKWVRFTKARVD